MTSHRSTRFARPVLATAILSLCAAVSSARAEQPQFVNAKLETRAVA